MGGGSPSQSPQPKELPKVDTSSIENLLTEIKEQTGNINAIDNIGTFINLKKNYEIKASEKAAAICSKLPTDHEYYRQLFDSVHQAKDKTISNINAYLAKAEKQWIENTQKNSRELAKLVMQKRKNNESAVLYNDSAAQFQIQGVQFGDEIQLPNKTLKIDQKQFSLDNQRLGIAYFEGIINGIYISSGEKAAKDMAERLRKNIEENYKQKVSAGGKHIDHENADKSLLQALREEMSASNPEAIKWLENEGLISYEAMLDPEGGQYAKRAGIMLGFLSAADNFFGSDKGTCHEYKTYLKSNVKNGLQNLDTPRVWAINNEKYQYFSTPQLIQTLFHNQPDWLQDNYKQYALAYLNNTKPDERAAAMLTLKGKLSEIEKTNTIPQDEYFKENEKAYVAGLKASAESYGNYQTEIYGQPYNLASLYCEYLDKNQNPLKSYTFDQFTDAIHENPTQFAGLIKIPEKTNDSEGTII